MNTSSVGTVDLDKISHKPLWIVLGTRPEAIKQIPLYLEACKRWGSERVALVNSGQHRELLRQVLETFSVEPDIDLQIFKGGQGLAEMSAELLKRAADLFGQIKPRVLVVQGDTTTAAMLGLAAFYEGDIQICHNEAGLRSGDMRNPFPEELNRQILARVADLHFAPTRKAFDRLTGEGVPENTCFVSGNTGVDALLSVLKLKRVPNLELLLKKKRPEQGLVLMTAHRRENRGESFEQWFSSWAAFLNTHPDLFVLYPQHPNDLARAAAEKYLAPLTNVQLVAPLDYHATCHVLAKCAFVVTDSGGLQEEGASLGIPVVVARRTSERMEAVEAGYSRLAGTDSKGILEACEWAYQRWKNEAQAPSQTWPFGRGEAASFICDVLEKRGLMTL